jgi:hypothetical protein
MQAAVDKFSNSLNKADFQAAIQVQKDMAAAGVNSEEAPIKVHTSDVYRKSFTFPQIANNDYAQEQFDTLNIAEQNLQKDPQSVQLLDNFMKTADEVAVNLKERYQGQWNDPKQDRFQNLSETE